jgi:hypothetical protein
MAPAHTTIDAAQRMVIPGCCRTAARWFVIWVRATTGREAAAGIAHA